MAISVLISTIFARRIAVNAISYVVVDYTLSNAKAKIAVSKAHDI